MLSLGPKVASVLGSMHWALVEFRTPVLAMSDHPVVLWPAERRSRGPEPSWLDAGLLHTLEVYVPVSPTTGLLMTWLERPDDPAPLLGHRHHALTVNAFVRAQAQHQWFHAPGHRPPIATGLLLPVSTSLHPAYSAATVAESRRRAEIDQRIQSRIGSADLTLGK